VWAAWAVDLEGGGQERERERLGKRAERGGGGERGHILAIAVYIARYIQEIL
jgi:hypothetical protein